MEIFVLKEKHGTRYILIKDREETARKIMEERIRDGWFDKATREKLTERLTDPKFSACKYLLRQVGEYEDVYICELEQIVDDGD